MIISRWSARGGAALVVMFVAGCDLPPVSMVLADIGQVVPVPLGALGFTPLSLEPGDFDGDGATDLLVGGTPALGGAVGAVLRGNDDGTLQPAIPAGFAACSAFPVVGDLDGDARSDAVTLGCASNLAVLVGQPDATLAPWSAWPAKTYSPTPVTGLAIGDFESDGDSDIFLLRTAANGSAALMGIELSNGAQGFWSGSGGASFNPNHSGFHPTQMIPARLDDDELIDLVLTDRDHAVATLRGAMPESFAYARELETSVNPWLTRVGDLNGDDFDDLVVLGRTDGAVQVLLSNGDGTMLPLPPVDTSEIAPYDAALGDLDDDGDLDVALVDDLVARVYVLRGDGAGGLGDMTRRPLPSGAIRVHATDLDGDDIDDIVAATFADDSVSLVLSTLP